MNEDGVGKFTVPVQCQTAKTDGDLFTDTGLNE